MKAKLLSILFLAGTIFTMNSCSSDSAEDSSLTAKTQASCKI
jgi:hypothetical protein